MAKKFNNNQNINELNNNFTKFKSRRRHYLIYNTFVLGMCLVIIVAVLFSLYLLFNNSKSKIYDNDFSQADKPIVTQTNSDITITIPHNNYFILQEKKFIVKNDDENYNAFYLDKEHLLDFYQQFYLKDMFHGPEISNLRAIYIDQNGYDPNNGALGFYTPYAETINLRPSSIFLASSILENITQTNRENNLKYVMQHEYLHHMVNTYYKNYDNNNASNILTSANYENDGTSTSNLKMVNTNSENWNKEIMNNYFQDRHYDTNSDIIENKNNYYKSISDFLDGYNQFPTVNNLNQKVANTKEPSRFMASSLMNMFNSTSSPYYNGAKNSNLSSLLTSSINKPLSLNSNYYKSGEPSYDWSGTGYTLSYDEVLVRDYCQLFLVNPLIDKSGNPLDLYAGQQSVLNGYYEDYAIRYNYLSSLYDYSDKKANNSTYKTYGNVLSAMNYGKTISYLNRNDNNYSFGGYSDKKYDWIVFDNSDDSTPAAYNHYVKLDYSPFFTNLNMKNSLSSRTKSISPISAIDNNEKPLFSLKTNHYAFQTSTFFSGHNANYLYFVKNTTGKSTPNSGDQIERVELNANNWNGNKTLIFNGNGSWYNDNRIYQNNITGMRFILKSNDNLAYLKV